MQTLEALLVEDQVLDLHALHRIRRLAARVTLGRHSDWMLFGGVVCTKALLQSGFFVWRKKKRNRNNKNREAVKRWANGATTTFFGV